MHRTELTDLTDDALVSRLSTLCAEGHLLTARLIVHLIEVEDRRRISGRRARRCSISVSAVWG